MPIVVITELEGKRHHPELGHFARAALRILDRLRLENGGLVGPVPVNNEGGVLLVELNHSDPLCLPDGFRLGTTTLASWRSRKATDWPGTRSSW